MSSFFGRSQHSLDDKGRLNLPVRVRETLAKFYDDHLMITVSSRVAFGAVESCLHLYPRSEFDKVLEKLKLHPASDPGIAAFRRKVVSNAEECSVDKQGRLLIPPMLREHAGLQDKVFLVGSDNILELWSHEAWARAQDVDKILIEQQTRIAQFGL